MKSKQAEEFISKIDNAIKDIESFNNISDLEKSYLAKFLVVFICGIYEEIIENIINERINAYQHNEVSKYIKNSLRFFRNPNIKNIKELLGNFDDDWKLQIDNLPTKAQTFIDNIVDNKNALAHGIEVTTTLEDIKTYYIGSKEVIEKIDAMLLIGQLDGKK